MNQNMALMEPAMLRMTNAIEILAEDVQIM